MRALAVGLLVVVPAFAGCFGGTDDSILVGRPAEGDVVLYEASGEFLDLARLLNAAALPGRSANVRLDVGSTARVFDGALVPHDAHRTTLAIDNERPLERWVDAAGVVASRLPLSETGDAALSFEERGWPWAFGASVLFGRVLAQGDRVPFVLRNDAGQAAPLALAWRVERVESGLATLALDGAEGARGTLVMEDGVAYASRLDLAIEGGPLAVHLGLDGAPHAMRLAHSAWELREPPIALVTPEESRVASDLARFAKFNRVHPPDPSPSAFAFPLGEAVAHVRESDEPYKGWASAEKDVILSRGTYLATASATSLPLAPPRTTTHVWLVQFVSRGEKYWETKVERFVSNDTGAALVTRVATSGAVAAPKGEHGWVDPDRLPGDLLTLASGVAIMRAAFEPDGVQVFVRSFTRDDGYGYFYLVDGGFERPLGRYTVTVNAQTGFVRSAVGPVAAPVA